MLGSTLASHSAAPAAGGEPGDDQDLQRPGHLNPVKALLAKLTLKLGRYESKYVLEGKAWRHDPAKPHQAGYFPQ